MIEWTQLSLLSLGFGLGLLHAFDADHIMAVSVMAGRRPDIKKNISYAVRWSLGHGGILLLLGVLLMSLGFRLSDSMAEVFEVSVGLLLIALGLSLLWSMRKHKVRLEYHSHGDVRHVHLHEEEHTRSNRHTPILVGLVHGLAGSAPVLALMPAVQQGNIMMAVVYLLLFGLGMLISMILFGFGLTHLQHRLLKWNQRLFEAGRSVLAFGSIGFGGYWVFSAI